MANKAVFFDRDGTLIVDKHYLHQVEGIEYYEDSFSALLPLVRNDYLIFIVTNQSGIGRGLFSEEQMHQVNRQIESDYLAKGIKIEQTVFCPHSPEQNCSCRKPSALLINNLVAKYNIDPTKSFMIGDKVSDVEAGKRAGMSSVLLTGSKNELTDVVQQILTTKNS